MSWTEKLATGPTSEPITLVEAKDHLRVTFSEDDNYISSLISVARTHIENISNLALITQTWDFWRSYWPRNPWDRIVLPRGPVQSIDTFELTDASETTSLVDTNLWTLDNKGDESAIVLRYGCTWPSLTLSTNYPVHVRYTLGFEDVSQIPTPILQCIYLLLGHLYENRTSVLVVATGAIPRPLEQGIDSLLANYRINQFGFK